MNFMDYIEAVAEDAVRLIDWGEYDYLIEDAGDMDDLIDDVMGDLWTDDGVTGNGSGSYTMCRDTAAEYAGEVLFDPDFVEECECMCIDMGNLLAEGPEAVDVTARCLALEHACDEIRDAVADRMETIADRMEQTAD